MKVLFVVGTRPDAIKLAIPILKFKKSNFKTYVVSTAQHVELLNPFLKLFNIKPDFSLNVMSENQKLESLTSKIIIRMAEFLEELKPQIVFVQGDTTTAFASCIAAFYKKIPVAHVEAGLRTYDFENPYPEEFNRVMIDRISTILFVPTQISKKNLYNEGIKKNVFVTGNTVIDAVRFIKPQLKEIKIKDYVLITIHRREIFGEKIIEVFKAIKKIAVKNPSIKFIYPVHLNPNVRSRVHILKGVKNICLIEPLGYIDFLSYMKNSLFIISDSGGVQEEAAEFKKRVFVIRKKTERPEGLKAGITCLTGLEYDGIVSSIQSFIEKGKFRIEVKNPFGDGNASKRILKIIENFYRI